METHRNVRRRGMDRILLAVFALMAVAFDPLCMDAFSLPKWTVLTVGTTALACFGLFHAISRRELRGSTGAGIVAFYGLLAVLAVSSWFSPHRLVSFFGVYAFRMDGFLAWLCYGVLFWFGLTHMNRRLMDSLFLVLSIAAGLVGLYGLAQYLGFDFTRWTVEAEKGRVWSSFGNPNFLGAYLAMSLPMIMTMSFLAPGRLLATIASLLDTLHPSLGRFPHDLSTVQRKWVAGSARIGLAAIGILTVAVLALTLSRAAWLGAAFGLLCVLILNNPFKRAANRRALIGSLLILGGASFFLPWNRMANRVEAGAQLSSSDWAFRKAGWTAARRLIRERPFRGYGTDGYHIHFKKHMDTSFFRAARQDQMSPVYPHNETLQIAVNAGLAGLALYLVFLSAVARAAFVTRRRPVFAGASAALLAVWVNNQLSFHNPATAALFFLLAGSLLGAALSRKTLSLPSFFQDGFAQKGAMALIGIAGMVAAGFLIRPYLADRAFKRAVSLEAKNSMEPALRAYNRALSLNRHEPTYMHRFAQVGLKLADKSSNAQTRKIWLEATGNVFRNLIRLNPLDSMAVNGLGAVHARLFQEYHLPFEKAAEEGFLQASALDPRLAEAWTNLGALYFGTGRKAEALEAYLKAKDINPYAPQVYNDLGKLHALQGRYADAERYWREALELDPNYAEVQRMLQMLASGQLQKIQGGQLK